MVTSLNGHDWTGGHSGKLPILARSENSDMYITLVVPHWTEVHPHTRTGVSRLAVNPYAEASPKLALDY